MKIAALLGDENFFIALNKALRVYDICIEQDIDIILKNTDATIDLTNIEALLIYEKARPKEQHKSLLYSIRSIFPNTLIVWFSNNPRDYQFESWAYSAVALREIIEINDQGEIAINKLVEILSDEHDKKINALTNSEKVQTNDKNNVKSKIVTQYIEKKVIVEKEIIVDKPTIIKGLLKVATFSISPGAGSTTLALRIGKFIRQYGKTAVVEVDGSCSLQCAKKISNVDYLMVRKPEEINDAFYELYKAGFSIIVTDYGNLFRLSCDGAYDIENKQDKMLIREFIKSDVKFGMAFSAPWHVQRLEFFTEENAPIYGELGNLHFLIDGMEIDKESSTFSGYKCFNRNIDMEKLIPLVLPDLAMVPHKKFKILNFFKGGKANR